MQGHDPSGRGTRRLTLFDQPVCNRGFCKLLGLGKGRFWTLNKSARDGALTAPLDGRYVPRGPGRQSVKRSLVYDFLNQLYLTAGETLPDGAHPPSNKRPRQGEFKCDVPNLDRSRLRHLPAGKFSNYYRLCTSEFPDSKISRSPFTTVWALIFVPWIQRALE